MSDSTSERTVTTDQELVREIDQRLDEQENPTSVRAGEWTLSTEDGTGNLMACHSSGGCVKIAVKPAEGTDPDSEVIEEPEVVEAYIAPRFKVKGGIQNIPNNAATLYATWNNGSGTADIEEPLGVWSWTGSTITIPEAGDYMVAVFVPWANNVSGTERSMEVRRAGTIVDLDNRPVANGYAYNRIVNMFRFAQGDSFEVRVYQNSGVALNCGGPNFGDAWAQLSVFKVGTADVAQHERGQL